MKTHILYCLPLILLTACQLPTVQRIPFPVAEYKKLPREGTTTVKGQVFMKTRGGDVKVGAGNEVKLNPVTSYSLQWYNVSYKQGKPLSKWDPRYESYFFTTTVDAQGNFELRNIPAGEYFLVGSVSWEAPVGYGGALVLQGGHIAKRIKVKDGKTYKVILSK